MGMTLSFTRATSEQLDRAYEDPEWAAEFLWEDDVPGCYLDKAWAGIQFLLDEAEVPVDVYEDGNLIDEECVMFGWDPDMVADAARALRDMPFATLAGHYNAEKMMAADVYPRIWADDSELDYLRTNYESLVAFFTETAAAGHGAIRNFSF